MDRYSQIKDDTKKIGLLKHTLLATFAQIGSLALKIVIKNVPACSKRITTSTLHKSLA